MCDTVVLNEGDLGDTSGPKLNAKDLINSLRFLLAELKSNFIDEQGVVNYKSMQDSEAFQRYLTLAQQLSLVDLTSMTNEDERKAFFINLYNCQMMHALVALESFPESPLKVEGMWTRFAYNVGGLLFTLDEIEHGVLRCNRGHPSKGAETFSNPDDPRRKMALETFDPRIHFALNCGALSCPPIRVYSPEKLNSQLATAAASFCGQEVEVVEAEGRVRLSKLLLWYKKDFGNNDSEVLDTLSSYIRDEDLRSKIRLVIQNEKVEEKIVYRDYNWTINAAPSK